MPAKPLVPPKSPLTKLDRGVHQHCVNPEHPWVLPVKPLPFKLGVKKDGLDRLLFRDPNYDPEKRKTDIPLFASTLDGFLVNELHHNRKQPHQSKAREAIRTLVGVKTRDLPMQDLLTLVETLYS